VQSVARATGFAVGLNWYLTNQTKVKLDYELTQYVGGAGNSGQVRDRENEHLISAQVQLTF
jgi:phosphate-selective porin